MNKQTLAYRGTIKGIVSAGSHAAFITTHDEAQPTALYRLDASQKKVTLTTQVLSCGATALVSDGKTIWLAGQDGKIYQALLAKSAKTKPKALSKLIFDDAKVKGLALLSDNRLAVLQSNQLSIIDCKKHKVLQCFSYTESAATFGSSPDGLWLAVGHSQGTIRVYQTDGKSQELTLSDDASVHKGAVTAIQFEADALRFYSSGADKKLLSTHAQGSLQPLDRGKSSNHSSNIQAICLGKERFFTGAHDNSIKAWPYVGGQPVSIKQGLVKISALAAINYQDKPSLMVVGRDASLRIVGLTPDDKFTEITAVIRDGYTSAKQELQRNNASEREKAITFLAAYDDKKALSILALHYHSEKDKAVCEKIVALVSQSSHSESTALLESFLKENRHEGVRQKAFIALVKRAEKGDLRPFEKALQCGHWDIGTQALEQLSKLAKREPRAEQMLAQALRHKHPQLRLLALSLLEKIYGKSSPKASLDALKTEFPDLQRAALIRLFQRQLLDNIDVKRAILLAQDQEDDQLRHTALLVSILSQKELTKALKTREERFAHQLQELEDFELLDNKKKTVQKKIKKAAKPSPLSQLTEADYAVLLQSMTSRHNNVCFNAAFGLAVLQDQRAFGVLLSLSQQADSSFHIGVCHALMVLGEKAATPSLELMLNDQSSTVREAAFTALEALESAPLITAERGLNAKHEDIHARGLKVLLDTSKKKLKKSDKEITLILLKAALNDSFEGIRQETFKVCLNQQLGGDAIETLHLLLKSQFENVHQEVLNELMAKSRELPAMDWVEPLLFELLNNPFKGIRSSAFDFAIKEKKRFKNQAVLVAAVKSDFVDRRVAVFNYIKKNKSQKNQLHLQTLLNDQDESLRKNAMALVILINKEAVSKESDDNHAIVAALKSPYDDVQVIAATALARLGDSRAYPVFDSLLSQQEPHKKHEKEYWQQMVSQSLQGLKALSDHCGFDHVMHFIQHKNEALVVDATQALPWVIDANNTEHTVQLLELQKDERGSVRAMSSYALALLGHDAAKLHIDNYPLMDKHITMHDQLAARLCLGKASEVTPITLESKLNSVSTHISATLALASHELLLHPEEPKLSTWGLSIHHAELQSFCAGLMACYSDEKARWTYVQAWLIEYHDDEKWTISIASLKEIAATLVYADGQTKAQLLSVMRALDEQVSMKEWALGYDVFRTRYAIEIKKALTQVSLATPAKPLQGEWNQRAFGTYLGLVRQVDQYNVSDGLNTSLKALRHMHQLAEQDSQLHSSVTACLLTLLNHPLVGIRQFAFDDLQALGMDLATLGKVATTSPQYDIARQGLQLLIKHYSIKKSRSLLQSLMQGDDDILSVEAYEYYRDNQGLIDAAQYALQSYHLALRQYCVSELAAEKDNKKAQAWLVKAVQNDHSPTAIKAATHLAGQSHKKAFNLLSDLLAHNKSKKQQQQIIRGLKRLSDTKVKDKVSNYLFDYLKNNKLNRQEPSDLYQTLAGYRNTQLFDGLLQRLDSHPKEAHWIMQSLLQTTGYDQPFEDFNEEQDDRHWIDKQHPRHDDLLIQLFNAMIKKDHHQMAAKLIPLMGWPKGKVINKVTDQALQNAIPVIETQYLPLMIQTLSHRIKHRQSKADNLLPLLSHQQLDVQYLAAEGLAINGHNQGFAILLAAVDYQENDEYRQRAVLALGQSGDQRALDKLLTLAQDKEHALNEVAIEAIGSMSEGKQADKIFKLMKSSLYHADYHSDMNIHALNGLRWFNTLAAWQIICTYIENTDHSYSDREHAVDLLQHWDTKASRSLLLKLLKHEEDDDVAATAYHVAQRLWKTPKEQTSEVDFALIQGHYPNIDESALKRIAHYASTADLLDLLAVDYAEKGAEEDEVESILLAINHSLLKRDDYTAKDLGKALESHSPRIIEMIARLLTRMDKLTKAVQGHLQGALERYSQRWNKEYSQLHGKQDVEEGFVDNFVGVFAKKRGLEGDELDAFMDVNKAYMVEQGFGTSSDLEQVHIDIGKTEQALLQLLWSAVKHGIINTTIDELLSTNRKEQQVFQLHILKALLSLEKLPNKSLLTHFERLLTSPVLAVRHLANQLMQTYGKSKGIDWRYFQGQSTIVMDQQFTQPLVEAAAQSAQQAQALPILIAKQDSMTLLHIASDDQQQETVRMGAIEGLAHILSEAAHQALSELHTHSDDEDISKAAYRALRRQQRNQARADQLASHAGA